MNAVTRREKMIGILKMSRLPVSGSELSEQFAVSRQIIVQDINRLRGEGYEIISTTKGYLLKSAPSLKRVVWVQHNDEQIADELTDIVTLGGKVLDVMVKHDIYGLLTAPLYIASTDDVADFLETLENRSASPLKNLTGDIHAHTIEIPDMHSWNMIIKDLKEKGYFISEDRLPNM